MIRRSRFSLCLAIAAVASITHAATEDPCAAAQTLWRKRHTYDVESLMQRVALRTKIIDMKIADTTRDQQAIQLKQQIIAAAPKDRTALWDRYDALMAEWNQPGREAIYTQYATLSYDRPLKRLQIQAEELEQRFRCLLNEPLNAALARVDLQQPAFVQLVQERAELIKNLTATYAQLKHYVAEQLTIATTLHDRTLALQQQETELDAQHDTLYDTVGTRLEQQKDALEQIGSSLATLSKALLPYVK